MSVCCNPHMHACGHTHTCCNDINHLFVLGWRRNYRSWRMGLLCTRGVNQGICFVLSARLISPMLFQVTHIQHSAWKFPCPKSIKFVLFIVLCLHLQGKSENMEIKVMCSGQNMSEHSRLKLTGFWYVTLPHFVSLLLSLTHLYSYSRALIWIKN
jgi:hypothetical protein